MAKIYYIGGERERKMRAIAEKEVVTTVDDIAKAFLSFEPMTHKKLQKLCYYAYSWYYTLYNRKLFKNRFEAWVHGPVDPTLYDDYRIYGWRDIPQYNMPLELDDEITEFIDAVYDSYGKFDGDELEYLTHKETPWLNARNGLPHYVPSNSPIEDKDIKDHYMKAFKDGQNE